VEDAGAGCRTRLEVRAKLEVAPVIDDEHLGRGARTEQRGDELRQLARGLVDRDDDLHLSRR
jgi:hypothetical protein